MNEKKNSGLTYFLLNLFDLIKQHKLICLVALCAVLIRIIFFFYVDRTWEDALITVLHAENFRNGLGLTHFHNGQPPVHGFTSPLSVLIPLLGEFIHPKFGIILIKIVSILSSAVAVFYCYAICRHPKINIAQLFALVASMYVAFEYQQILWGMSGLETQIVVTILLISMYYLIDYRPDKNYPLGITLGFCMLARPDMLFWCIIAGFCVLAKNPKSFLKVFGWAFLIYLPWLIFTVFYYGSVIPNTIIAKTLGYGSAPMSHSWYIFPRVCMRIHYIFLTLAPGFSGYGTACQKLFNGFFIINSILLLSGIGSINVIFKKRDAIGIVGFFIVYSLYYFFFVVIIFGWYLPPINAVAIVLAALGLDTLSKYFKYKFFYWLLCFLGIIYILILIYFLPLFFKTDKDIQIYIDNGVRKNVGLYLNQVMKKSDTVALEPLGYSSYYSRRDIYDTPGLCNKRVVEYYKALSIYDRNLYNIIQHFYPNYTVLRPGTNTMEYGYMLEQKWFTTFYESDKEFSVPLKQLKKMWHSENSYDKKFVVFKKREIEKAFKINEIECFKSSFFYKKGFKLPITPIVPEYVISSNKKIVLRLKVKPTADSKILMFVQGKSSGNKNLIIVQIKSKNKIVKQRLDLTGNWSLVSVDSRDFKNHSFSIIILNPYKKSLFVTQPFILKINEKVKNL